MKNRYPLDPESEDGMDSVEHGISEALAPIDIAAPRAAAQRSRLLARVRRAREAGAGFIRVPLSGADWQRLLPGVRVHRLDAARRAVILELSAGASLPVHRHHEDEECVVLRGEAQLGNIVVRGGDYHLARANSRHGVVRSAGGALLYLRGTPIGHGGEVLRDLVAALLPGDGQQPLTMRRGEGRWDERDGLPARLLREDASSRSYLLRLPAGTALDGPAPLGDECLLVEGEAGFDDWLMAPGDYQRARTGAGHVSISSDTGALLFVREEVSAR